MELNKADLKNITALITFAFHNGMVKSQDDARVLLILEQKVNALMNGDDNGDNIPDSSE